MRKALARASEPARDELLESPAVHSTDSGRARRYFGAATASNSRICAMGGEGDSEVVEYNPVANTWIRAGKMLTPRNEGVLKGVDEALHLGLVCPGGMKRSICVGRISATQSTAGAADSLADQFACKASCALVAMICPPVALAGMRQYAMGILRPPASMGLQFPAAVARFRRHPR